MAGAAITWPLQALSATVRRDGSAREAGGYVPLVPVADGVTGLPLLMLPDGFRYVSFGWVGDPLDNGTRIPPAHDGMAAFAGPAGLVHLVRNHEIEVAPAFDRTRAYDDGGGGG